MSKANSPGGPRPLAKKRAHKGKPPRKKISRTRKPQDMSLEEWQIALRRDFGREQDFEMKNIGNEPIFSEFAVTNPDSGRTYRVAIRGLNPGDNYCSCPDFSVNALGTCKHIEFTLAKLERKRGAKKAFREGFRPAYSEVFLRYGAQRQVCFRPGVECPRDLVAFAEDFFDACGALRPDAYLHFHTFLKKAPRNGHDLRCYEDAIEYVARIRDELRRVAAIEKAFPKGVGSPKLGTLVNATLFPYQCKAVLFAAKAGRCLIADDMGLGKTIEAIAAIEVLDQTVGIQRVLVIAPTSVKHQWKQEIERFTGRTVEVVEGLLAKRAAAYRNDTFYKITNYDVIHRDMDLIEDWAPDVIILDEAQRIKNWKTRRARSVKRLESEYAMVLTGTPLENRLEELHSIIEFVDRFRLGALFRFLSEHQHVDENGRVVGYHNLSQISKTLAPVLIRRTKDEVLKELPERVDNYLFVPMTEEQWEHHEENKKTVGEIVAKWRRFKFLSEKDQRRLMIALQNMRMACNSTYLLDKTADHSVKPDELMVFLEDVLEEAGTKVVVFSQWIGTHELIIDRLESRNGWGHVFYHGSLYGPQRRKVIEQFKEDPGCRILLCTDSGGVGLNLQNASVVAIMDQPWNPAVLEQRIGRVHRLGQARNVRVAHFVSQGTIEHGMLQVLSFKKSVFAGVLDGGEDEVFLGGSRLKKFMETVDNVTTGIPAAMPRQEEAPAADAPKAEEILPDDDALGDSAGGGGKAKAASRPSAQGQEVWDELIATGMAFIGKLGQALQSGTGEAAPSKAIPKPTDFIATDSETGETFVKLPMPGPDALKAVANALGVLADALQGRPKG